MKTTIPNVAKVAAFTVGYGLLLAYAVPRYLIRRSAR